uniref:Alpha-glutamyl/putrescinyl thymine pyrophosphorylase clade 3 domain-containing protein n=1 Tax=Romanomermis culicivorax TaxID=13658 RepID=A0A915L545_ROMCU
MDDLGNKIERQRTELEQLRISALKRGLISPNFATAGHNVDYNNSVMDTIEQVRGYFDAWAKVAVAERTKVLQELCAAVRAIEPRANYFIAMLAFGFRTRGHHYMVDMEVMYDRLWGRLISRANETSVHWKSYFTIGLHAIMPDFLDAFWVTIAREGEVAGTLCLRVNCAAAGTALWRAMKTAADDVFSCFPKQRNNPPILEAAEALEAVCDILDNPQNRWVGSINRRYYGAADLVQNETKVAPIAAMIRGVYTALCPNASYLGSKAGMRAAGRAPLIEGLASCFVGVVTEDVTVARAAFGLEGQ